MYDFDEATLSSAVPSLSARRSRMRVCQENIQPFVEPDALECGDRAFDRDDHRSDPALMTPFRSSTAPTAYRKLSESTNQSNETWLGPVVRRNRSQSSDGVRGSGFGEECEDIRANAEQG